MGHRGLIGFVADGQEKLTYSHHGSYPDGNGLMMLDFARKMMAETDRFGHVAPNTKVLEQVRNLTVVGEGDVPTLEQREKLAKYADTGIRDGNTEDWYVLLHGTQGDLDAILECGYLLDGASFAADSLFNEGSYLIDLDANTYEAYDGFIEEPHNDGRFAKLEPATNHNGLVEYYPIRLIGSWPLADLPTDEEFLEHMIKEEED